MSPPRRSNARPCPFFLATPEILWDAESLTLSVSFAGLGAAPPWTPPLVSQIGSAVGIADPAHRLALGDLVLTGESNRLLCAFDIRRAPEAWLRHALDPIGVSTKGAVRLEAAFDDNGLASIDVDIDMVMDEARGLLSIRRRPVIAVATWVEVATAVWVGLGDTGGIVEIRMRINRGPA